MLINEIKKIKSDGLLFLYIEKTHHIKGVIVLSKKDTAGTEKEKVDAQGDFV